MLIVYTKPNCEKCEVLKDILQQAEVKHAKVDVIANNVNMTLLREKVVHGTGFPMVEFPDGQVIAGDIEAIVNKINQN